MIYELVVTSVPRGLQAGRSGFTTVLRTRGIHPDLCNRLEAASGYRHVHAPGDPRNPQIRAHIGMPGGQHVLSRIVDAGNDYSGRSNKLAHHLAFDAAEVAARAKSSPAAVLLAAERAGLFQRQWAGEPREQPAPPVVPSVPVEPGPCGAWSRVAGDAGWAGFIADRALRKEPTWIIAPPGVDLVELFAEALALVNYPQRWGISFTTYAQTAGDALWLGTQDGSPESQTARGQQRIAVVDLVRRPPLTMQSPTIDAARGTAQVPWKRDQSRPAATATAPGAAAALPIGAPIEMGRPAGPVGPGAPPAAPGAGPLAPPPMGGPPGAPPPMANPLGGPPAPAGVWRSDRHDGAFSADASPQSGFGIKVLAIAFVVLILAGVVGVAVVKPELGEKLLAMLDGSASRRPVKDPDLESPPAVEPAPQPTPEPAPQPTPEPAPQPTPEPAPQPTPEPAPQPEPAPPAETPQQRWDKFKKKLAEPGGRYPKDSLDGDRDKEQVIKICHVGELNIGLELHGANSTFPDRSLEDKTYYLLSEQSGSKWTLQYKDAQNNSTYQLGDASVDEKGWLTVVVPARETQKTPSIQLAREALACSTLTIVSNDVEGRVYVQLRRPDEYGPLVIEKFFANGRVWPNKKNKAGVRLPAELPVPEVILPPNPWKFELRPNANGVNSIVLREGAHSDLVIKILQQSSFEGSFGVSGAVASSCLLTMQVAQQGFWNPRIDFNRSGLDPHDALTVSVDASDLKGKETFAAYSRFGHFNKAPAQKHEEKDADAYLIQTAAWFPLSATKVNDFAAFHVRGVGKSQMSNLVHALLPVGLFASDRARKTAIAEVFKGPAFDSQRSLKDWQEAFREFVKNHQAYKDWCGHPGREPDPKKEAAEHKKWADLKALREKRLLAGPEELRAFMEDMRQKHSEKEAQKMAAPLLAVCEAIEQLPQIDKEKQETHALLKRMLDADLVIEGQLLAWAPNHDKQPCVLATFAAGAGRKPVVIGADMGLPKHGLVDGATDADVAAGDAAVPGNAAAQ